MAVGTILLAIATLSTGSAHAAGRQSPLEGPAAEVEYFGPFQVDTFRVGAKLYTNRDYTLKETPAYLQGKPFVRNSIDRIAFRCTQPGLVTLITPDPADPIAASLYKEIEQAGFTRIETPKLFQLFGAKKYDLVRVYQKKLKQGEEYRWGKWAVLLGPAKVTTRKAKPPKPWSQNQGQLLYNGIRLPQQWPPAYLVPESREPMPVPYLDHPPKVIPIDTGRQLFVDDFLIESTDLTRRFHKAQKYEGNPVLKPQTKLELNGDNCDAACPKSGGVWWDPAQKQFRMWYEAGWIHTICYATSRDGLIWERPNLDIQAGTNRILDPALTPDSWAVFPDYETKNPNQRWKMYMRPPGGDMPGLSMVSPDGIHWSKPIASGDTGDRSTMFYNPFRKKWVYSLRSGVRGRSRHYWEHDDFLAGAKWKNFYHTFGPDTPVFWAAADRLDPPDPQIGQSAQLYNLDAVGYESLMLGFYQIHLGPPNSECMKEGLPKITELNLAYSRDGFHWQRPDRSAFIPATRRDTWDRGYVQSIGGICLVRGDRLWFYYTGFQGNKNQTDKHWRKNGMYDRGATGVAFLRRDGFASMNAGKSPATLTTRPLRFSGKHLFVNIDNPQGTLHAEVLDEQGQPIAPFTLARCKPVATDSTIQQISWQDAPSLVALAGRPLRLRFHLKNGSLYSFWISPNLDGRSNGFVAAGGPGYTGPTDTVGRKALEAEAALKNQAKPSAN